LIKFHLVTDVLRDLQELGSYSFDPKSGLGFAEIVTLIEPFLQACECYILISENQIILKEAI
jgi:hypothetical protein